MKKYVSMRDLVERFGVTQQCIRNWINAGQFPQGVKFGRARRWDISEVEVFEASKETGHE